MKKAGILIPFTVLVTGLPLLGVYLSGRSAAQVVSFPPLTRPAGHAPFSWPIFSGYLLLALGLLSVIGLAAREEGPRGETEAVPAGRHLPWWGWPALAALMVSWFLAWTRMPWFVSLQADTFIPLWLSAIVFANALCFRQTGSCPLVDRPRFLAALFPVSAAFWWYFEYLNQFVHNWYYTGVDYGAIAYSLHATISFATVLPAVYTIREWVFTARWFRRRFYGLPSLRTSAAGPAAGAVFLLACLAMIGISLRPDALFAMLWIAPLVLLTSLQSLTGQETLFSTMSKGDWRPAVSAALAAMICGFFWEMWNYYSLAKWMYSIPYVSRFAVFEMPVLGYMGYLPFGLECIAVAELFDGRAPIFGQDADPSG